MKSKTKKKPAVGKAKKKPAPKAKTKKVQPKATKKPKKVENTHILALIDKSSSMNRFKKEAISGFNTFLASQKKLKDRATINVTQFSNWNSIDPMYDGELIDVKNVSELNELTYRPNGSTALHDAMVKEFTRLKLNVSEMKPSKRPDKILVVIITDGEENDSREYPKTRVDEVRKLVEKRKEENWQFIFMCSTEDTALTGEGLGFSKGNVFQYANTTEGNATMFASVANAATMYRSTSLKSKNFSKVSNNLLAEDEPEVKEEEQDDTL